MPKKVMSVILDKSVVTGIHEHCLNDSCLPVIGLLGGHFIAEKNIMHVIHFVAMIRSPVSFLGSSNVVESQGELDAGIMYLKEKGFDLMGVYCCSTGNSLTSYQNDALLEKSSHLIQLKMSFSNGFDGSIDKSSIEISYLNDGSQDGKISLRIRNQVYLAPSILREMNHTLRSMSVEVEKLYEIASKNAKQTANNGYFIDCEYDRFCTDFLKSTINQSNNRLELQYRNLCHSKLNLKKMINNRIADLTESFQDKFEGNVEDALIKMAYRECQYSHSDFKFPSLSKYTASLNDFLCDKVSISYSKKAKTKPVNRRRSSVGKDDSEVRKDDSSKQQQIINEELNVEDRNIEIMNSSNEESPVPESLEIVEKPFDNSVDHIFQALKEVEMKEAEDAAHMIMSVVKEEPLPLEEPDQSINKDN